MGFRTATGSMAKNFSHSSWHIQASSAWIDPAHAEVVTSEPLGGETLGFGALGSDGVRGRRLANMKILLVSYCLQLYSFAFHAARSADSSGRSRPSQKIGHSWNHFSRLQIECTDLLCPKSA